MIIMKDFEAVMMTFHKDDDESIAMKSLYQAQKIIENIKANDCQFDESELRESLELYLTAFWGLPELREELSQNMHILGRILREFNFCELMFDNEKKKYYTTCPCILLHNDFGFSLRGTEKYKCSICGKQTIECEHITGYNYDNVTCFKYDNVCNICLESHCEHIEGENYDDVFAYEIVYDIKVITFDMVHTPKMAFARTTKIYFEKDLIYGHSNNMPGFIYGMALNCDHCIICKGYNKTLWENAFNK